MTPEYVYFLLFVLLLIEGIGVPGIPFEAIFLAAGYYIQTGEMSFVGAVAVGTLGNLAGNLIGYWLGAKTVPVLLRRFTCSRAMKRGQNIAMSWFERYGAAVVVISRWFGLIRTPTIVGAAAMGMKPGPYTFYSAIGAFTWTLAWQYGSWKGLGILTRWWRCYRQHSTWWLDTLLITGLVLLTGILIFMYYKKHFGTRNKP